MEIRSMDRDNLCAEYGALTQRLLPWDALNAPFEGSWAVIEPGTASEPHSHHEYEIFIATAGTAIVEADGERRPFKVGDVAFMPPNSYHTVINDGDVDFIFYSVWWDPEMSARFTERHAAAVAD